VLQLITEAATKAGAKKAEFNKSSSDTSALGISLTSLV
jgi:hypothetical protein